MNRRTLLVTATGAISASLGGCVGPTGEENTEDAPDDAAVESRGDDSSDAEDENADDTETESVNESDD
ncbi:hypothetical protein G6M89_12980 [Natronolimnobius sp. AArcel1]|uniref:hypothetical protein n=1 Tax=Natronolimnobius sp. AArcel1 TaxID=1679093 RepID=UPI0013EBB2C7|nr:hypothetical protein [Natronolimnobius sp. AArcel1]NGM69913.1 hypothetical protein [Natronolimnobius sp. AArcel1]